MKYEYHEGPKAWKNFEKAARTVLQAPRVANPKRPARKPITRKTTGSDEG